MARKKTTPEKLQEKLFQHARYRVYITEVQKEFRLTKREIAVICGCSQDTVKAWSMDPMSKRFRFVSEQAVVRMREYLSMPHTRAQLEKNRTIRELDQA